MEAHRAPRGRHSWQSPRADVVRNWKGIANVPLPGGPGTGPDTMTIYVQMPDTLALNVNSRVRVADVYRRARAVDRVEELGRHADPGLAGPR